MILEAALVIGGLITTIAIGGPIASSLVTPHVFRRPSRRDPHETRARPVPGGGFKPLDLGPDPMEWPSQKEWSSSGKRDAEWPSREWDDEHFGRHWREGTVVESQDAGFHAMAERSAERGGGEAAAMRRAESRRRGTSPHAAKRASPAESPRAEAPPARQAPGREELEAMIVDVGLAGTVQAIMERTGWDFRKAAHYLARTRQL